jgi:hypothetical protein
VPTGSPSRSQMWFGNFAHIITRWIFKVPVSMRGIRGYSQANLSFQIHLSTFHTLGRDDGRDIVKKVPWSMPYISGINQEKCLSHRKLNKNYIWSLEWVSYLEGSLRPDFMTTAQGVARVVTHPDCPRGQPGGQSNRAVVRRERIAGKLIAKCGLCQNNKI